MKSFGVPTVMEVNDSQSTVVQEIALGNVEIPYAQAQALGLVGTRTIFFRGAKLTEGQELTGLRIAYVESLTQGKLIIIDKADGTGKLAKYTSNGLPVRGRMVLKAESEEDIRLEGDYLEYDGAEEGLSEEVVNSDQEEEVENMEG